MNGPMDKCPDVPISEESTCTPEQMAWLTTPSRSAYPEASLSQLVGLDND